MAVQARYPSNVLLFNRSEQQERKEMDYSQAQAQAHQPPGFLLDQPPLFFANGVNNGNQQRKRGRETCASASASASASAFQMVPTAQMNLFSSSIQSHALVSLAQLQQQTQGGNHRHQQQHPSLVSTGLRLSFEDNDDDINDNQPQSQFIQQDLASLVDNQKDEIEQFIVAQGEQLRRTLADRRQKHYGALLAVAEESASRRLREKDVELDRGVRRSAELEDRIARLRTESLTWQAKAMADQATAASLHAQIQHAQMATAAAAVAAGKRAEECCGESAAEDAESAHVDPDRVEDARRSCRACRGSAASVVLLPCRHLCLCIACDAAVGDSDAARCPVCHAVRTGSVQVFLS